MAEYDETRAALSHIGADDRDMWIRMGEAVKDEIGEDGLPEEGAHEKSPKCPGGNLGDFGGILQRSLLVKAFHSSSKIF